MDLWREDEREEREGGRGGGRSVSVTRKSPTVVSLGNSTADVMVK